MIYRLEHNFAALPREVVARQLVFWLLRPRFPFPPRIRVVKTSLGSDVFPVHYG